MKKKLTKEDYLWRVNYKVLNCYLDFYREEGIWVTTNQSWNLARWNIYGNVLISKKAIRQFLKFENLDKSSKAVDWNGRKGSRCFVAEHVVPFKVVKELYLKKFSKENPTFEEYKKFFLKFNRLCYVWHEEDLILKNMGLNDSVPDIKNIENKIFERYIKSDIEYIETNLQNGNELFKKLKTLRSGAATLDEVISSIKKIS